MIVRKESAPPKTPVYPICRCNFAQNQIWLAIAALAVELTAWMQMLALTGNDVRRWEPKRLRLRLFSIARRIARHARRTHLRLSAHAPSSDLIARPRSQSSPPYPHRPDHENLVRRDERTYPPPEAWKLAATRARADQPRPKAHHRSHNAESERDHANPS